MTTSPPGQLFVEAPSSETGPAACLVSSVDQDRLDRARAAELRPEVNRSLADMFKALGDPTRLKILRGLGEGELCVCELSELLDLSVSAVSHQLRKLRDLRLVDFRMEGRFAHYRIADPFIAAALALGVEHLSRGPVER